MSDCIFCKIIKGDVTAKLVHSDERLVAFEDINPQAPVHVLIVPTEHLNNNLALTAAHAPLMGEVFLLANTIARSYGIDATGFRVVTNCGSHGGQTVGHIHFHLLGGRPMTWPPG
ncbi:MAG: histidine triad nucleotide-binding protein [Nitrospinae bacterium]|nr:histidine triad nucleotide-binding protein [Nitrospinota bacterium]